MKRSKVPVGEVFGLLTVIREVEPHIQPNGQVNRKVLCVCKCGKEITVQLFKVRSGYTKSCGCLRKQSGNISDWYDYVQPDKDGYKSSKGDLKSRDKISVKCTLCENINTILVSGLKTAGSYNICKSCARKDVHHKKRNQKEFIGHKYLTSEFKNKYKKFLSQDKIKVKCPKCNEDQEIKLCDFQKKIKKDGFYNCGSCTQSKATTQATPKRKLSVLEKYGVSHPSQRHIPKQSLSVLNSFQQMYDLHIDRKYNLQDISKMLGVRSETISNYLVKLKIPVSQTIHTSGPEKELTNWIKDLIQDEVLENNKSILYPKHLDIFIPSRKVAIEFNGLRWHSEKFTQSNYHLEKTLACKEQGIFLLHVWEDDWMRKKNIVKGKITSLLKKDRNNIFARKTKIYFPSSLQCKDFLEKNHIQGNCSSSIKLGLEYENQIVSIMTLKRRKQKNVWELVRFASSLRVVGGFSKLLTYFKNNFDWIKIISFADRACSEGNVYEKTDWQLREVLSPDYKYIVKKERKHKFGFRHKSLKIKLKNYDPMLTEHENMFLHGLYRIYDCGLLRYEIENPLQLKVEGDSH